MDDRRVMAEFAAYKEMAVSRFPFVNRLALKYLSVPNNSVDAERSVSLYNNVSAAQRQVMSMSNLASQVVVAKNSRN
jgi:hypothetical protein